MKKALLVIGVLLVLLVAAIIVLPVIFKDDIVAVVKEEANNSVNASINFGNFDISMISSFPDFSFSMDDILVSGIGPFENDTLMYLGNMELTVDLMSVVSGDEIAIKTITLNDIKSRAIVLEDGTANWDIAKDTSSVAEEDVPEDTTASAFSMSLKRFSISNADIVYDDREGDIYTAIKGLNFDMSGDFTQDLTTLLTQTRIEGITVKMDHVNYLNEARVTVDADIDADLVHSKYTFKENRFVINGLELGLDGWVAMPEEDIEMDVRFNANKTDFRTLLSLVPAIYARDFEDIQTKGKIALEGYSKGVYSDLGLPGFGIDLKVEDAMFKYPDLPGSAENININVSITNPGGNEDNTIIDVSSFHIELAGNPMDMHLVLKTPVSDPLIDCGIKGDLDLGKIKEVVPLEDGEEMQGMLRADIVLRGNLSTIENEDYENFDAQGGLIIENIHYQSKDFPQGVIIESAIMNFSPQNVDLANFDCKIGKSDLHLNGTIDNFIGYALTDTAVLKGRFVFSSSILDLNEFMTEEESDSAVAEGSMEDTTLYEVIEVPGNIDFLLASKIDRILYDKMDMTKVFGQLRIKDKEVKMQDLTMNMLGGTMLVNGSYNTRDKNQPGMDFDLEINEFDIPSSYKTFGMMEKMAPIMENCQGSFSSQFKLTSTLDQKMEPVYSSMNGGGGVQSNEVVIKGSPAIEKLSAVLKNDKYKELALKNLDATFTFKEGRLFVDPFETKLGNSTATISGSNGFDLSLDYLINMEVPTSEFGSGVATAITQFTSMINSTGANVSAGDAINVEVAIGGTTDDPIVSLGKISPVGGESSVKEQVAEEIDKKIEEAKEVVKEEVGKAKEEAKKQLKKEADKIIKEAERQAAKLIEEAKKLSGLTKKEGYDNAQKLEKEASNPLQKIAAKAAADQLRKETDKQAQKIIDAAAKKAKVLVDNARVKAGNLK